MSQHRNGDTRKAVLIPRLRNAIALVAEDKCRAAAVVDVPVVLGGVGVSQVDRAAPLLEPRDSLVRLIELDMRDGQAHAVAATEDLRMGQAGAPVCQHQAGSIAGVKGADQGTEVAGNLDSVSHRDEGVVAELDEIGIPDRHLGDGHESIGLVTLGDALQGFLRDAEGAVRALGNRGRAHASFVRVDSLRAPEKGTDRRTNVQQDVMCPQALSDEQLVAVGGGVLDERHGLLNAWMRRADLLKIHRWSIVSGAAGSARWRGRLLQGCGWLLTVGT